jgi:hypothetical protein
MSVRLRREGLAGDDRKVGRRSVDPAGQLLERRRTALNLGLAAQHLGRQGLTTKDAGQEGGAVDGERGVHRTRRRDRLMNQHTILDRDVGSFIAVGEDELQL